MDYDVIIIGAGPAGYVAAIRAGQVGLKTAVIEKQYIGGMCLNWGCIPTKSLIESAKLFEKTKRISDFGVDGVNPEALSFNWSKVKSRTTRITKKLSAGVQYLLKKNGVDLITGNAVLGADHQVHVDQQTFKAKQIIIATGSKPKAMDPAISGLPLVEMEKLFTLESLPEHIVVTGNHVSAVEMAQFFRLIGKQVTLVSNSSYFLDGLDEFLIAYVVKKLQAQQIQWLPDAYPEKYEEGMLFVGKTGVPCDLLLNINSRKAIIPESEIPLQLTERGFIKTNDAFETNLPGVYAIGDVSGKSFVAHVASAQGLFVVNSIKGIHTNFNAQLYPINMYTQPEIAQIGKTEQALKAEGIAYKVNEFPLSANGKALIEDNAEGYLRLLSDTQYGQVLGVQIVAANATDMIAEAAAFMSIEGTVYDVAQTIHAHPTVAEIFMEAGFDAVDKAIHK
ncbi:MAG: dihydrolipoyl dehydrogenase [Microbacter sp.]